MKKNNKPKGYYFDNEKGKYRVRFTRNGQKYHLGYFETEKACKAAIKRFEKTLIEAKEAQEVDQSFAQLEETSTNPEGNFVEDVLESEIAQPTIEIPPEMTIEKYHPFHLQKFPVHASDIESRLEHRVLPKKHTLGSTVLHGVLVFAVTLAVLHLLLAVIGE